MKIKKLVASYSVLNEYRRCPTSFYRRYVQALVSPDISRVDRGSPLTFGRFVHQFLELYHGGVPANDALSTVVTEAAQGPLSVVAPGNLRSISHLELLLRAYIARYPDPNADFAVTVLDGKPALECEVDTLLSAAPHIIWRQHMDGLVTGTDGAPLILEHKTAGGNLEIDLVERMLPNDQAVGYIFGARKSLGLDVRGVLFNGLCTYRPLVNPTYRPKPGSTPQPLFLRRVVPIADWQIAEWEAETLRTLKRMMEDIEENVFAKNAPDGCTIFNSRCAFSDLCKCEPSERANLAELAYERETWKGFELELES